MTTDTAASALATERDTFVRRALASRFLAEQSIAELSHVPVAAMAIVLVWGTIRHSDLLAWALLFVVASMARRLIRQRVSRNAPNDAIPWSLRLAIAGVGAVWGIGVILAARSAPVLEVAVLLVIICGITAGATSTLLGDAVAYHLFAATILGLTTAGVLPLMATRPFAVATALVVLFGIVMVGFYGRLRSVLTRSLITEFELGRSREAGDHERAFLNQLIDRAPNALVVTDDGLVIRRVNPAFEAMFGYSAAEAVGQELDGLVVPTDQVESARSFRAKVVLDRTSQRELLRQRRDGSPIFVRVSAALISTTDAGMLVIYDDISEMKQAEQAVRESEARLFQTLANLPVGIMVLDPDGIPYFVNDAATRLLGKGIAPSANAGELAETYATYLTGTTELYPTERMPIVRALNGERTTVDDMEIRRPDRTVNLEVFGSPIYDRSGNVIFGVATFTDITERRRVEETVRAARVAAEEATASKSAFLANMSHEIRTPLNGILGMAELLLDGDLSREDHRSVELIVNSGETLLHVINDILDFSKIEARQLDIEHTALDLAAVVESTARLLMPKAVNQGIEIISEIPDALPPRVLGDPVRLRQVLTNLVGNAVKFTSHGEVVVKVEMSPMPTSPDDTGPMARFRFSVRDTGMGIPADKLDTIFEAFRQADATTTRRYGGTGLGLSISRRLVELMGGQLEVESTLGVGSAFRFDLVFPILEPAETQSKSAVRLQGVRVLVVDDNATNRRVVRAALENAGCVVDDAADGAEALIMLRAAHRRASPYQVAITDLVMPVMDGFDLIQSIRGDAAIAHTATMMLTSLSRRGDAQRCRELGVGAYLLKPVSRREMLDAVGVSLGLAQVTEAQPNPPTASASARPVVKNILLAEDNVVNQEVAAAMLRRRGHSVHVVETGRAAVDAARDGRYDVILMDIQMPELDGLEATREIRRTLDHERPTIIALTANAMPGERERCLAAGMDGYLSKPFKGIDLFAAVEAPRDGSPSRAAVADTPTLSPMLPVDLAQLRTDLELGGVGEIYNDILDVFMTDSPGRMETVRRAVSDRDARSIERAAHALKSAAATIHAETLATLLQELERVAHAGAIDDVVDRLAAIEMAYQQVHAQLTTVGDGTNS